MICILLFFGQIVWEYRTAATAARTYPAIGEVVAVNASGDSCIYVIGGQSTISQTRTTYEYDCSTDAWATRAQMPAPARYDYGGCSAIRAGIRRIYVMGGYQSVYVYLADVDEYTPSANTWTSVADMPTPREGVRIACVGNMIYAIGGDYFDGYDVFVYDIVERYDPETNTWTTGYAAMPTARTDACCAVAVNENSAACIYVFGGSEDIVSPWPTNAIEEYNPATNTWRARNSSGSTARWGATAITAANKIYFIGGTSDGSSSLNLVEVYDPVANAWSTETPIQQTRDGMTGGTVGGRIYAVVGSNGNTVVNTNERSAGVIGIEEITDNITMDYGLTITPNPARGCVNIMLGAKGIGQRAGGRGYRAEGKGHSAESREQMVIGGELQIYDAGGRLVRSFVFPNSTLIPHNSVTWQCDDDRGSPVPAGVYFIRASLNSISLSEKAIVLE
jgi:N-acetylneuraminic acid mutarotase